MQTKKKHPELIRRKEAEQILESITDLTTRQLMNLASAGVIRQFVEHRNFPAADFDFRFFMEVMLEFCDDHDTLKKILNGEDLRWWDDEGP